MTANLLLVAPALAAGGALFVLAAVRPAVACAVLALAIPLVAGLQRGAAFPLLRVNEALLLVVAAGFLVHRLPRWRPLEFTGLDVVVLAFCLVGIVVPWGVITVTRADAALDDWQVVVAPVQYLVVYLLYSRVDLGARDLRLFFNLTMLASIPVAAVAVAEALDLPGVRDLVSAHYPAAAIAPFDPVYRPSSLLGHYSAVGAFGLLNLLLALALAATRHPGFRTRWLVVVMSANLLSLITSQTYAPIATLPVAAIAVLLFVRRLPWRYLAAVPPLLAASAVAFWPAIVGRLEQQFGPGSGASLLPETVQTRVDYWQAFFVPALIEHGPLLGTGTLIPDEVPRPLVNFVDNGYLWQLFRAGLPGMAVLLTLLASVAAVAWSSRASRDTTRRALGAVCLGAVVSVALVDLTSEYLTFTAVSQEFWMLVGLLSGAVIAGRRSLAPPVVELRAPAAPRLARVRRTLAAARALAPERALLRASAVVLVGFGLARVLGFAFQVVAGRTLSPDGYGRLTYALAVASVAAVLLTTAPMGLSRFLARSHGDEDEQRAYYVNWLAVVGLLLAVSAAVTAAVAGPVGLGGWMLAGLLANLLGVTALETYREVQRGLGRYTLQAVFYVLANAVQLAAVVGAVLLGRATPELFLVVYGLSAVAALALLAPADAGPGLDLRGLRRARLLGIAGFMRPVLLQAVLWNVWFNADLILLEHLRTQAETGTYGAAKTIATGFAMIPSAIAFVFAPRVTRLSEREIAGHAVRVLAFTAAISAPIAVGLIAIAGPLTTVLFGGQYAAAWLPLVVLLAGMVPYGLRTVLSGLWFGLGHPVVETASSGVGMTVTLAAGLWLVPALGAPGAAVAFSAGAVAMLLVDAVVTIWAFGAGPRVRHRAPLAVVAETETEAPAPVAVEPAAVEPVAVEPAAAPAPAGPHVLLLAPPPAGGQDDATEAFVRALEAALASHEPALPRGAPRRPGARWAPVRADGARAAHVALRELRRGGASAGAIVQVLGGRLTLGALLRGRILQRLSGDTPLAVVAVRGGADRLSGRALRLLAPDLLLLPGDGERDAARAEGVVAQTMARGVGLERLARRLDELASAHDAGRTADVRGAVVLAAKLRRGLVDRRDWLRARRWPDELGYRPRTPSTAPIVPTEEAAPPTTLARTESDVVGVVTGGAQADPVVAAAELLGLTVQARGAGEVTRLADQALLERWRLLSASTETLAAMPAHRTRSLATFVQLGGTLLLHGLGPGSNAALRQLGAGLGVGLPLVRRAPAASHLLLPGDQAGFARELAGTRLQTTVAERALRGVRPEEVLALAVAGDARLPAVIRRRIGDGSVVMSVLDTAPGPLPDVLSSGDSGAAVVSLLLLRQLYGLATWHAPIPLANFSIDDPALRDDLLGMPYDLLAAQARDHRFHVTVATVPRELALADAAVVRRLRDDPCHLSACYHGCDHSGYEFYLTSGAGTRYAPRPLEEQRRALRRAVDHGRAFGRRHRLEVDPVMVFPYGVGPAGLFPELHRLGFLATCNYGDKYPLEAPVPADPDLGLRPADLAWEGFPLLWRRGLEDGGYLLDLVLGRPLLLFAHRGDLGRAFAPLVERADVINRAAGGAVRWRSLGEIARHAYLQRLEPGAGWAVLMTGNEACLHNPDHAPRTYTVTRPNQPDGSVLEVDGAVQPEERPRVVVAPGETALVRLVSGEGAPLAARPAVCSCVAAAARPGPITAATEVPR